MANVSPYPYSLTRALKEASTRVGRKIEFLLTWTEGVEHPYQLDVRLRGQPAQKHSFKFETHSGVEEFLLSVKAG